MGNILVYKRQDTLMANLLNTFDKNRQQYTIKINKISMRKRVKHVGKHIHIEHIHRTSYNEKAAL